MATEEFGRGVADFEVGREIDGLEKKEEECRLKDEISDDGSYEFVGGDGTESDEVVVEVDHFGEGSGGDLKVVENPGVLDHNPSVDIATLEEDVDERGENSTCVEERDRVEAPKNDSDVVVDSNEDDVRKDEVDDADCSGGVKSGKDLDDAQVLIKMPESDAATVDAKETSEFPDEEGCRKLVASSVIDKINNDLIEIDVAIEGEKDYETTATGVMEHGSSVIVHSYGVIPNNDDIGVNPHLPGEEIERGNASEEKCEMVSAHSGNDCLESDAEGNHSDEENLKNRSVSVEMENVEVVEDGSKEVALDDNDENASTRRSIQIDSVENEKGMACEAATTNSVKDGENILSVDIEKMDLENSNKDMSCSLKEVESLFETTHAPIKQWAIDGDVDGDNKVDIASTNTETLDLSSLEHNEEKLPVETQAVKTEINKDSDTEQSEIVSREVDSIVGVNPNEVLPSKSEDTVSSFSGKTVDSKPKQVYCYMIKIPRFFDNNLMAQKEDLELQVDEKTKFRDSINSSIHSQKAVCEQYSKIIDAARKEEKVVRDFFNAKRREIDAIQITINKMKNATAISEINDTINKLERRIQHETIPLKEEKHIIHEIKTLKQNRDKISSTLGPMAEVLEAYDQKNLIEEQYENLKQELNSLRSKLSLVEINTKSKKKKYDDECLVLRNFYAQCDAANNLRQQTYSNLWNIKNELYEKNIHFYQYKDDRRTADNFKISRNKHSLKQLCADQVEKYMELWNRNDEFRNHYVKCNMSSTLRRFKTVDGRLLGPDEVPTVLPNIRSNNNRLKMVSLPSTINDSPMVSSESVTPEEVDLRIMNTPQDSPVKMQKSQHGNPEKSLKVIPLLGDVPNVTATVGESVTKVVENKNKKTEDDEMTRKANEIAQQEEASKKEMERKEIIRSEQIAKAQEAAERKKRKAERAKARAESKAQKEAELKEKKKAKKVSQKEKNEANASDAKLSLVETTKEPESIKITTSRRPANSLTTTPAIVTKQNSKLKRLPFPRHNKGKRKMPTWIVVILIAIVILVMLLLGNYVSFSKFNILSNLEY